jgi:hypothetical protein
MQCITKCSQLLEFAFHNLKVVVLGPSWFDGKPQSWGSRGCHIDPLVQDWQPWLPFGRHGKGIVWSHFRSKLKIPDIPVPCSRSYYGLPRGLRIFGKGCVQNEVLQCLQGLA